MSYTFRLHRWALLSFPWVRGPVPAGTQVRGGAPTLPRSRDFPNFLQTLKGRLQTFLGQCLCMCVPGKKRGLLCFAAGAACSQGETKEAIDVWRHALKLCYELSVSGRHSQQPSWPASSSPPFLLRQLPYVGVAGLLHLLLRCLQLVSTFLYLPMPSPLHVCPICMCLVFCYLCICRYVVSLSVSVPLCLRFSV